MLRSDFCHLKLNLVYVLASGLCTHYKSKENFHDDKKDDADEHYGMFSRNDRRRVKQNIFLISQT